MSATHAPGSTPTLAYTVLHFAAALGIAVVAGGIAFFVFGLVLSFAFGGAEAVDSTFEGLLGSLFFAIVLVGLCGGVPGMIFGLVLLQMRVFDLWAFIVAGAAAAALVPLLVMMFTPLGISGWSMLLIAVPSGAIAAIAAHYYLAHFTTLLK